MQRPASHRRKVGGVMGGLVFGDLVVNLIARVNGFTRPMAAARGALGSFHAGATSAVSGVLGTFGRLAGIGSIVGGALGGLSVMGALTWGASLAIQAEQAQIAFATMLRSPEKAKSLLADMSKFAAETPYESPEVVAAAKQLLAYGTSADQIIPQMRMLGDVASGVGMPIGDLAYLFGTAQVQGRLFAKDINQFSGRGIPIIEQLAAVMGVTKGEVMGLASEGKVTSEIMQKAFERMTGAGGQFGGMMVAQSKTTAGLWSKLKDNVGLALRDVSAALMDAFDVKGSMADVISWTETFRANLDSWMPTFRGIGTSVREWIAWFVQIAQKAWAVWTVISPWVTMLAEGLVVLAGMWATWSAIAAVVALVLNPVTWIVAGIVALGAGLGWALEQFGGLVNVLTTIAFGVMHFGALSKIVALEMLLWFTSAFNGIAFFFTGTLPALFGYLLDNGKTMVLNLAAYATQVFQDLASRLGDVFHDIWALVSGGEMVGVGGAHWGALGGRADQTALPELKLPKRETSEFEKSLGDMLRTEREQLTKDWNAIKDKPLLLQMVDGTGRSLLKDYKPGGPEADTKTESSKLDMKPLKLSGALQAGSKEAYSAIVQAMVNGGPTQMQVAQQQLAEAKQAAKQRIIHEKHLEKISKAAEREKLQVELRTDL